MLFISVCCNWRVGGVCEGRGFGFNLRSKQQQYKVTVVQYFPAFCPRSLPAELKSYVFSQYCYSLLQEMFNTWNHRGTIVQGWGMCFQLIHWPRTISKGLCQIYVSYTEGRDLLHQDNAEHKQKHQSCIFREAKSIQQRNVSHIIWAYGYWCYWIGLKIDVTTTQSLSTMATVVWQA